MTRMAKKKKRKLEFSKWILIIVSLFTIFITGFTLYIIVKTGDTSPLMYLIPSVFAELATATGFYYSKAKVENRIKLAKIYGVDVVNMFKE